MLAFSMPMTRSTDGTEDDLPTYIRRAFGHDRTWMQDGACHSDQRDPEVTHMAWVVPAGKTSVVEGVSYVGEIMEAIALPICYRCPQQWLCTRWAVEVEEPTGTWGIRWDDLKWLHRQPDKLNIVDNARVHNIPMQKAVALVREIRVG